MKKHHNKKEETKVEKDSTQEKIHLKEAEKNLQELSEEEQEDLRAEARERYNRLLGCGG